MDITTDSAVAQAPGHEGADSRAGGV